MKVFVHKGSLFDELDRHAKEPKREHPVIEARRVYGQLIGNIIERTGDDLPTLHGKLLDAGAACNEDELRAIAAGEMQVPESFAKALVRIVSRWNAESGHSGPPIGVAPLREIGERAGKDLNAPASGMTL